MYNIRATLICIVSPRAVLEHFQSCCCSRYLKLGPQPTRFFNHDARTPSEIHLSRDSGPSYKKTEPGTGEESTRRTFKSCTRRTHAPPVDPCSTLPWCDGRPVQCSTKHSISIATVPNGTAVPRESSVFCTEPGSDADTTVKPRR